MVKAVENSDVLYNYAESVGISEASAMALPAQIQADLLIIDDAGARRFARKLDLNIIGTVGVILNAKINGIIPSIRSYLLKFSKPISESLIG